MTTIINQGETLFIGCFKIKPHTETVDFCDWILPLLIDIREKTGKIWQLHKYREGSGMLAGLVQIAEVPENMYINPDSPSAKIVLEDLKARYKNVIG